MSKIHEYVTPQARGVLSFPSNVRERLRLDQPGAQLEIVETEDGRLEIRGVLPVPADQKWFWSERWQEMEREADSDISEGRTSVTSSLEEFLTELDS